MQETLKEIFDKGPEYVLNESFYRAIENKKLVFFIGAGISRVMGVPGWNELAFKLIKSAFPDYIQYSSILNSIKDNKQLITIAFNEFSKNNNLSEFYKYFSEALKPTVNQNHEGTEEDKDNIYKLLSKFDAAYLTTNADNLFEEVLGKEFCHVGEDFPLKDSHLKLHHLYYLHGHYTNSDNHENDYLVFTAEQYVRQYNDRDFQEFLRTIFNNDNVIFFIGYGLGEYEIIDYIITKTGGNPEKNKIFILEPFCENDDIIYQSKMSYFESLNIKLLPYNISKKGYKQIIDFLNVWYDKTKKNTVVPVMDDIANWCGMFNQENFTEIVRLLKKNDLSYESAITNELLKNNGFSWLSELHKAGLFSKENIGLKVKLNSWPLLSLLLKFVSLKNNDAQNIAVEFLDLLSTENIETLSQRNSTITDNILFIIMYLDKYHISDKYLNIAKSLMNLGKFYYLDVDEMSFFDNIVQWNREYIEKVFDIIFSFANFKKSYDDYSYSIIRIFEKMNRSLNKLQKENPISNFIFEYFICLIHKQIDENKFNIIQRLYNLDHIQNNYYEYWKITFKEILFCFEKINSFNKIKYISELLSNNIVDKKIGLYLTRKFNLNIDLKFIDLNFFNSTTIYFELFLFFKSQLSIKEFSYEELRVIYTNIQNATWGIDVSDHEDDEYWNQLIVGRKIEMMKLFNNQTFINRVKEFETLGFSSCNSTETSEKVDYVHSFRWTPSVVFPNEEFEKMSLESWGSYYEKNVPINDSMEENAYTEKFVDLMFEKNGEDYKIILSGLETISLEILINLMSKIRNKINDNYVNVDLGYFCIRILDKLYQNKDNLTDDEKHLVTVLIEIIRKLKDKPQQFIIDLLSVLYMWLPVFINTQDHIGENERILDSLINRNDFEKYSLIVDCHIELKEKYNIVISEIQKRELIKAIDLESDKTLIYSLCFNYQNMKYISNNSVKEIFDYIFDDNHFELSSLLFSIYTSNYLFDELVDLVKNKYIGSEVQILKNVSFGHLSDSFYNFIMSAYFNELLTEEEYLNFFNDNNFIESLLSYLPTRIKKDGYDFNKWVLFTWEKIKQFCDTQHQSMYAEKILFILNEVDVFTNESLDLYIEIISCIAEKKHFYDLESLKPYFSINFDKADKLMNDIIDKFSYVSLSKLEEVISVYSCNHQTIRKGKIILNKLKDRGLINIQTYELYDKKLI